MIRVRYRAAAVLAVIVCLAAMARPAYAGQPAEVQSSNFKSYTYSFYGVPVESPDPYTVEALLTGVDSDMGAFNNLQDLYVSDDGSLFVADTNNDRIVEIDSEFRFVRAFEGAIQEDGGVANFNKPLGVFVDKDNTIYIADTENARIVQMSRAGNLIRIIGKPTGEIIPPGFIYKPAKLVVDKTGRIHVLGLNVNQGIMEFDVQGKFEGFLAAGKVTASPIEIFWKRFSTREQRERMADFAPIEYSNIDIDDSGFLYTTSAAIDERLVYAEAFGGGTEQGAIVRKLNILGQDILPRTGRFAQVGDIVFPSSTDVSKSYRGVAQLTDVASAEHGVYHIVDNTRKRIFTYDGDGNLLYAFGGAGSENGGFRTPFSIAVSGERLYVADKNAGTIIVYAMTHYAKTIRDAIDLYENGNYAQSTAKWREVLAMNANLDIAYSGIGKAEFEVGNYKEAMRFFKLAHHQVWYSMAFKEYRKTIIERIFPVVAISILAFVIGLNVLKMYKNKKHKTRGERSWQM